MGYRVNIGWISGYLYLLPDSWLLQLEDLLAVKGLSENPDNKY